MLKLHRRVLILVLVGLGILLVEKAFSEESVSYRDYIISDILSFPLAKTFFDVTTASPLEKRLYLFRRASENVTDEKIVLEAFEYWKTFYNSEKERDNFVALAYVGALESMYGGVVRGVIKKISFVRSGLEKLNKAVEISLEKENPLEKFYTYFMLSQTLVNLPAFFKEFRKDAKPSLEKTLYYFNKTVPKHEVHFNVLKAKIFLAYGLYYEKIRQDKKALKYYDSILSWEGDEYEEVHEQAKNAKHIL